AVCDRWFASIPGPTWPNRFFWHAASSGGLDDSPPALRAAGAPFVNGYHFINGTIEDRLEAAGHDWAVYHGDIFPQALAIAGMDLHLDHFHPLDELAADLGEPHFGPRYVFIEPDYGHVLPHCTFAGGSSQHPIGDIGQGERLIKEVYEAIRSSPHWEHSLLVISHDEHGGFYDHVPPPPAVPPGDGVTDPHNNRHGFDFSRLGPRVPAVVVSPLIPRGTIDHVLHDHTSALATVERIFRLRSLTRRDARAHDLSHLLSLARPRGDAPRILPDPVLADPGRLLEDGGGDMAPPVTEAMAGADAGAEDDVAGSTLNGFLQVALRRDLVATARGEHAAVIERVAAVRTRGDAGRYMHDVARRLKSDAPPQRGHNARADGPRPDVRGHICPG
ncbi:MAG: alkaline phosphatase family protein, partial [Candidatus Dormibacteria bacterium]